MRPDRPHERRAFSRRDTPAPSIGARGGARGGARAWRPIAPGLALAVALLLAAGAARAQPAAGDESTAPQDYDTESREWNGLHTLTAVARGLGLRVEATGDVQWEAMGADDILFVLYPETRVDPGDVATFIRNGGHVLIADDFGDSVDLLGRLGMLRTQGSGVPATRFYRDLEYAPVAAPMMPEHPLAAEIQELTTNVPGVLTRVQGADVIFGFGPDAAVVVAGNLGRGRFVVVSDASIFINRMLQFEGNLQLVINAIRYLSREGRAMRMVLLTRDFSLTGDPVALLPSGTVRDRVTGATLDVNRLLDAGNDYLLTEWALRVAAVVLALVAGFLAVWSMPSLRRDKLDGEWARAVASARVDDFASIVARYEQPGRDTSFALPAAVLRDTLNRALARTLRYGDPLGAMQEPQLVDAVRALCGDTAAQTMARLHPLLKPLPVRHQAASSGGAGYVSQRDFEHLRDEVNKLLLALGDSPDIS